MIIPFQPFIWINSEVIQCDRVEEALLNEGRTVYEVVRVMNGKILFLEDHITRLEQSARLAGFELWQSLGQIRAALMQMCTANGFPEGNLEISANYRSDSCPVHRHLMAWYIPHSYPSPEQYQEGVDTLFYFSERVNPNAKYRNQPLKEAANAIINNRRIYEVVLVDRQGNITEGSRSNLFLIKNNALYTAPAAQVLLGITRMKILEIAGEYGIKLIEQPIPHAQLSTFESAFITGTSPKVLPVRTIENHTMIPQHPLTLSVMKHYDAMIAEYIAGKPE